MRAARCARRARSRGTERTHERAPPGTKCAHGYRPAGVTPTGVCPCGVRDRNATPAATCGRDACIGTVMCTRQGNAFNEDVPSSYEHLWRHRHFNLDVFNVSTGVLLAVGLESGFVQELYKPKPSSEILPAVKEGETAWADSDSDESSSGASSSSDSEDEVRCLMADDTEEIFDLSNPEFTREDLVTALNEMVLEYKKLSQSFKEFKAEEESCATSAELANSSAMQATLSRLENENAELKKEQKNAHGPHKCFDAHTGKWIKIIRVWVPKGLIKPGL
ncbi:hypothetical protein F511_39737 [Dorcoceras hygrometricum]|uniref:Uncharacterized protein n=1 Tax=Dorcoceras hygrometricum TaxID=472368 RepID=A0A2Z7D5B6_9LAMI|nr:hypothetical protein F511_39737 [Dorcoceras hygrometricum]